MEDTLIQPLRMTTPAPWPRPLRWVAIAGLWTIPGVIALSYYYLNSVVTAQDLNWTYALSSTLPNWYFWAIFTPVIIWQAQRFPIAQPNAVRNVLLVHLPLLVLVLLVHSLLNLVLFRVVGLHETINLALYEVHFDTRVHANILAYLAVLGFYHAYDYYRKYE